MKIYQDLVLHKRECKHRHEAAKLQAKAVELGLTHARADIPTPL